MNTKQKNIMLAINIYVFAFLMTFITRVTKAYIGMAYPEQTDIAVQNLITFPSFYGMAAALLIGPIAMKIKKSKLAIAAIAFMVIHNVITYFTGLVHGPFALLHVGAAFGGVAIGIYITLLNSIISDHFPPEKRAACIAKYNVWINIGGVIILYVAGWLAEGNNGANWYNAYLLGILPLITMIIFAVMCKKNDVDTPSVELEDKAEATRKLGLKDMPKDALVWIILMGLLHCFFYVTQSAFNVNVSSYIITEYSLGTSVEAGTATSLVRFALIPFTALYPFFKKFLKDWMIPVGYFVMAIGLVIMMVSKSLFGAYACAIFCGMSTALVHSEFYARASRYVSLPLVPVALAIVNCLVNVGTGFSSYILKFFGNLFGGGMGNALLAGAVISVVIAILASVMYVFKRKAYVD